MFWEHLIKVDDVLPHVVRQVVFKKTNEIVMI